MANQRDLQRPSRPDENVSTQPGRGHGAKNKESCGKVGVPKTVLKKHKCDVCVYSTDYKGHLNRHLLKHTGEKPNGCTFCSKRFTTKQNLRSHMKAHVEEFLFNCPGCLQGFDGRKDKTEHETNCKIRRYECHLCKESIGSLKANMVNHMREPVSVDELVDVSVSTHRNAVHVPGFNERDAEYDFDHLSFDEVKAE
ncbi:zinc finger protein 814-like, partial [Sitodiplosis mosellana]|uniref:zinc finger protein 814-like n=1 Tax=Sitodiplosis mosellana TaxID=263140 RepID=UPI002445352A